MVVAETDRNGKETAYYMRCEEFLSMEKTRRHGTICMTDMEVSEP